MGARPSEELSRIADVLNEFASDDRIELPAEIEAVSALNMDISKAQFPHAADIWLAYVDTSDRKALSQPPMQPIGRARAHLVSRTANVQDAGAFNELEYIVCSRLQIALALARQFSGRCLRYVLKITCAPQPIPNKLQNGIPAMGPSRKTSKEADTTKASQ